MVDSSPREYESRIVRLEEKLAAADKAKELQAREYERRLQDLNHAHRQAMERNATFVSREIYDGGIREAHAAINAVKTSFEAMSNSLKKQIDELAARVNQGIGIVLAVQVIGLVILKVWK